MKKSIIALMLLSSSIANSQFGVNYYQSLNSSMAGFNYEIKNRFKMEMRLGSASNGGWGDRFAFQSNLLFDIINKDDYEFYLGVGAQTDLGNDAFFIAPLGFNFYPLESKKFGFHIELISVISDYDEGLRASAGIRYRFIK